VALLLCRWGCSLFERILYDQFGTQILIIDQEYVINSLYFFKQKSIFEVVAFLDGRLRKGTGGILMRGEGKILKY
jgi:hypothetical protein